MVDFRDTMERLNEERAFEEKLAIKLNTYFIASLDNIKDINDEDKKKMRNDLLTLMTDSQRHSDRFDMLLQMVIDNGEGTY